MRCLALVGLLAVGCAHGILVNSDPTGADVTMDGMPQGKTPCTVNETEGLPGSHTLILSKAGYRSHTMTVGRSLDALPAMAAVGAAVGAGVVGWVCFWPACLATPIGLGALFSFKSPDAVSVTLEALPAQPAPPPAASPLPAAPPPAPPATALPPAAPPSSP